MAGCNKCGVWYHYPKDSLGQPLQDGVWVLGLTMPCAGTPLKVIGAVDGILNSPSFPGATDAGGDWILFANNDATPNSFASVAAIVSDEVQDPNALVDIGLVAQAIWTSECTLITQAQGRADKWVLQCADQPPGPVVQCPQGFFYDPRSESCKPLGIGQLPVLPGQGGQPNCPPGTTWDPVSQTCKPDVILPPPDQSQMDEIEKCCAQAHQDSTLILKQLEQLQLSITGNGQPLDPVTCGQLTGLFGTLNKSLAAIVAAIAKAAGAGGTAVDLTPLTAAIEDFKTAMAAPLTAIAASVTGDVPPLKIPPDRTAAIDKVIQDSLGGIPSTAAAAQELTS